LTFRVPMPSFSRNSIARAFDVATSRPSRKPLLIFGPLARVGAALEIVGGLDRPHDREPVGPCDAKSRSSSAGTAMIARCRTP